MCKLDVLVRHRPPSICRMCLAVQASERGDMDPFPPHSDAKLGKRVQGCRATRASEGRGAGRRGEGSVWSRAARSVRSGKYCCGRQRTQGSNKLRPHVDRNFSSPHWAAFRRPRTTHTDRCPLSPLTLRPGHPKKKTTAGAPPPHAGENPGHPPPGARGAFRAACHHWPS
jgi:hypothetical protein